MGWVGWIKMVWHLSHIESLKCWSFLESGSGSIRGFMSAALRDETSFQQAVSRTGGREEKLVRMLF